jgi:hypothetical protein
MAQDKEQAPAEHGMIPFYTPTSFVDVADRLLIDLKRLTGFAWMVTDIQRSQRKLREGAESYLEAKLYPVDTREPYHATLSVSLLVPPKTRHQYKGAFCVFRGMRPIANKEATALDFETLTRWMAKLSLERKTS